MNLYIFVAAAVLSVIPILVIFKVNIGKLKEDPRTYSAVQKHFFIGAGLSKIVPIILLIFGIIKMTPIASIQQLYIPGIIIIVLVGFSVYYILSKKREENPPEAARAINTLTTITLPHVFTIPLMALFFLFLML